MDGWMEVRINAKLAPAQTEALEPPSPLMSFRCSDLATPTSPDTGEPDQAEAISWFIVSN